MPEPDALIVDLGSNDGTLLRAFKERGMRVLGIDPAREIARQATEAGIETLPLFFNGSTAPQVLADYGHAAIITCNNLFANIDQLDDVTDGIHHLLRPDGVFIFESFYLVDFVQNMVFDFAYHEHLSYFSVTPLVPFFKRHHLELIDVQRVSTKGGSLRYTVQIEGGPRSVSPAVTNLLDLEAKIGTVHQKIYQKFAVQINAAKNELLKLLDQIQAEGNTLAGYGASATTTTLLYHFGLTDRLAFIADDYPAKQHRYSPGKHIPVLAPEALYEKKPDYVVIMAWRYVEPIVAKHQEYLAQGGKFIVPLPELKVIEKGH